MVKVNGKVIVMTRGDTLKVRLKLQNQNGTNYTPAQGDVIKFGAKTSYDDTSFSIEKTVPNDTLLLHLVPNDTKNLNYGTYVWDLQITFANGDVNTFVEKGKLKITEEVV